MDLSKRLMLLEIIWWRICQTLQPSNGEIYVHWIRRFIPSRKWYHPHEFGKVEIETLTQNYAVCFLERRRWAIEH